MVKRVRGEREAAAPLALPPSPLSLLTRRRQSGFTLLELMIVISILVILALIAMGQYNRTVLAAKEATLREDLYTMRKMIDQYAADKGKLPQSLDDLKAAGYVHDIPIDPMTDAPDWQTESGHSSSTDMDSLGEKRYSEW
jgi:general secretion pathway protein G